jgi:hypothetical protein
VDTSKTEVRFLGATQDASFVGWHVVLTNTTTVTATRDASTSVTAHISFEVTEKY